MSEPNDNKEEKGKLNNPLLNFSYRQTRVFIVIVLLLCILSFIIPVISVALVSSGGAQSCSCGCSAGEAAAPSIWHYVAAGLTGLVNALAVASVAIGIYSVAEAKAASDENARTCRRIERIDDDMEDILPQLGELQKHVGGSARRIGKIYRNVQTMLLQMERVQAGVKETNKKLDGEILYKGMTSFGSASSMSDDYEDKDENLDGNDM